MQEEVTQKTIALVFKSSRLTADVLKKAMKMYLERRKAGQQATHGKMSVKKLVGQGMGASSIEVTDNNIKSFERVARKYNVDFAVKKDKTVEPPKYMVFFKGKDADVITQAFKEFVKVVTFEQLGVDRLFVDESHNYKNLFLYTKMRNVAGIAQTEAQKSSDMFAKCQYLDEITGGKGVTFATGTPISNSMTELYTNMRYLQYGTLQKLGLGHFDAWAASFGETQTAIELAPEGYTLVRR